MSNIYFNASYLNKHSCATVLVVDAVEIMKSHGEVCYRIGPIEDDEDMNGSHTVRTIRRYDRTYCYR